jgi:crotonobetainyl-CoA:carnitine CoA-transferase CaiB-like acyl-CoA transferase
VDFFAGHDICFSPVNNLAQVAQDPQIAHRGMIVSTGGEQEKTLLTGIPIKLSETPGEIRAAAPRHGEHTKQVLLEAGYSEAEVNALAAQCVI